MTEIWATNMRVVRTDAWRMWHTPGVWVGAAGIMLAMLIAMGSGLWVDLPKGVEPGYHVTLLLTGLDSELLVACVPICATLAYGTAFVEELDSGYVRFSLSRCSSAAYAHAKALVPMLGGAASLALGVCGTWAALALIYGPFESAGETGVGYPLGTLLSRLLLLALNGGLWSGVGTLFADLTRSKYTAYAAPFIFYYVLVMLQERYVTDWIWLSPRAWVAPQPGCPGGMWGTVAFLVLIGVATYLINRTVIEERLQ